MLILAIFKNLFSLFFTPNWNIRFGPYSEVKVASAGAR